MAQYIDKAAVIAEIERRINIVNPDTIEDWRYRIGREHDIEIMKSILSFIDTLEVKEVDLENLREELDRVVKIYNPNGDFGWGTLYNIALHFFELGLKTQKGE